MKKFLMIAVLCVCACGAFLVAAACSSVVSVSGISFSQGAVELNIGDEYQLGYTIFPENASNTDVYFTSSDESIATVESGGTVLAVSQGEAVITVVTEDGNCSASCIVTVNEKAEEVNQGEENKTEEEQKDNPDESEEEGGNEQTEDSGDNEDQTENQEQGQDAEDNEDQTENQGQGTDEEISTTYAVTFIADNEIVAVCEFTEENTSVNEPDPPEKEGYTVEWESYSIASENITVNAVYTPIPYEITFIANNAVVEKITFTVESVSVNEPLVPEVIGYAGKWESYSLACRDITVNAVYTLKKYTITYVNIKGAENENPDSYDVENGFALVNLSAEGYIFEGWYIGDERVYSVNALYGDLTITAEWSLVQYEIRFVDENYNKLAKGYYTIEDEEITFPESLQKEGYTISWLAFELTYDVGYPVTVHIQYTKIED